MQSITLIVKAWSAGRAAAARRVQALADARGVLYLGKVLWPLDDTSRHFAEERRSRARSSAPCPLAGPRDDEPNPIRAVLGS